MLPEEQDDLIGCFLVPKPQDEVFKCCLRERGDSKPGSKEGGQGRRSSDGAGAGQPGLLQKHLLEKMPSVRTMESAPEEGGARRRKDKDNRRAHRRLRSNVVSVTNR